MHPDNEKDCCVGREQYWSELTIEGKLERARQFIKKQGYEIDSLNIEIRALSQKFSVHNHLNDNIVYRENISLESYPGGGIGRESMQIPENPNEVYF